MQNSMVRRITVSTPMIFLLLILPLLTMHQPASATIYTYTGHTLPFIPDVSTQPSPPDPAIGVFLTCHFTYDGALTPDTGDGATSADLYGLVPFTMSFGAVSLSSEGSKAGHLRFAVTADVPTLWWAELEDAAGTRLHSYYYWNQYSYGFTYAQDYVIYRPVAGTMLEWGNEFHPGVWTAGPDVPLPASILLFGTGLIPLAWARRKKRLGK